jgi:hypothetical protein
MAARVSSPSAFTERQDFIPEKKTRVIFKAIDTGNVHQLQLSQKTIKEMLNNSLERPALLSAAANATSRQVKSFFTELQRKSR